MNSRKGMLLTVLAVAAATMFTACTAQPIDDGEVKRIEKPEEVQEEQESTDTKEEKPAQTEETEEKKTYKGFCYHATSKNGEGDIYINMTADEVVELLGEPNGYFEAPSCALDGMDKVYTYDHCEIYVTEYPDRSAVSAIYLTDDLSSTAEGLTVGDTDAKRKEIYGEAYKSDGYEYTYRKEDTYLRIQVQTGKVSYIYYMVKND